MESKELRIGNLIYKEIPSINATKEIVEVLSIDDSIDVLDVKNSGGYITEECSLDIFQPIPLTEEWLVKFGFTKGIEKGIYGNVYKFGYNDCNYVLSRDWREEASYHLGIEYTDSPYEEDDGKIYNFSFKVMYVHQLQNLWFTLIHKELK